MDQIKIHVLHTGEVCISPNLAFGGDYCNVLKAAGIFQSQSKRIWLPVSCYLIEHPKGKILVDTGWHRDMSPNGVYDKMAQIKSLGSRILYRINQGKIENGATINEQLEQMGIAVKDLDYVLLSHLDCDHVNGLKQVKDAKRILAAEDELVCAKKYSVIRYQHKWWDSVSVTSFQWNGDEGPAQKSYDLFGDESVRLINIPGHADGLFAVKIRNEEGKYVLLYSDGGYAKKSWEEMISSGIALNKTAQKSSLNWIREQSIDENCVESLANHDPDVTPHTITI